MLQRKSPGYTAMLVPIAALVAIGSFVVDQSSGPSTSSGKNPVSALEQTAPAGAPKGDDSINHPAMAEAPAEESLAGPISPLRLSDNSPDIASFRPASRVTEPSVEVAKNKGTTSREIGLSRLPLPAEVSDPREGSAPEEYFVGVDPSSLGHAISNLGVRVAVEGQITDFAGEPKGLELSVTPKARTGDRDEPAEGELTSGPRSSYAAGFSREEALFRMKWGWAAYDAAKRAAQVSQ